MRPARAAFAATLAMSPALAEMFMGCAQIAGIVDVPLEAAPAADVAVEAATEAGPADAGFPCVIGGRTYADGTLNPMNPCETCQPAASRSAWTNLMPDAACGGPSCASGMQLGAGTCDGNGSCNRGSVIACTPFTCGPAACKAACASDVDCAAGNFCLEAACVSVKALAAGGYHTCVLTSGGSVECWGANESGQLGNGAEVSTDIPVPVTGLSGGIAAVSSGVAHTCAVTTAGGVECWGGNPNGELGDNSTAESTTPAAVSGLSSGVVSVAAGNLNTCAVTTEGAVSCWGDNTFGQLGNNCGQAAKGDGGCGPTTSSLVPVTVYTGLSSATAVAMGYFHACALIGGGVYCWGRNAEGELGNNSTTWSAVPVAVSGLSSGVSAIAAGYFHACALTTGGAVQCWGANSAGQLGNGSMTASPIPVAVSGLSSGVAWISAGGFNSCAVTDGGAVQCWGDNDTGQLGNDGADASDVPSPVVGLPSGIATMGEGVVSACALTLAGAILCWGGNHDGELGNNSTTPSTVPVSVIEP